MRIDPAFDQVATRYLESLTHLHSANGHHLPVCRICRGATAVQDPSGEHWKICRPCLQHRHTSRIDPRELADAVGFIIYALEYADRSIDQSLRDMYQYKILPPGHTTRQGISEPGQRIRTLLYVTLQDSLPLLARTVGPVDLITEVPGAGLWSGPSDEAGPLARNEVVSPLKKPCLRSSSCPRRETLLRRVEDPCPTSFRTLARAFFCNKTPEPRPSYQDTVKPGTGGKTNYIYIYMKTHLHISKAKYMYIKM